VGTWRMGIEIACGKMGMEICDYFCPLVLNVSINCLLGFKLIVLFIFNS
jgi:hypothetical protein